MPQQHYPQEADAKQAAKLAGLTEEQFEVVSGPKGFTYRKRKLYKKVEKAKLHVGPEPLPDPVPIPGFVPGTIIVPSESLPEAPPKPDLTQKSAEIEEVVTLTAEKRICPECKVPVDTFISGDVLRYIEHTDTRVSSRSWICNMSEEEVVAVVETGISVAEFKPHEIAQIQNAAQSSAADEIYRQTHNERGEKTSDALPHLKKSIIPNPSKTVWVIADEMITINPSVTRKEVIERCIGSGIAFYTARTQYQQWRQARKESIDHAAHAPTLKGD